VNETFRLSHGKSCHGLSAASKTQTLPSRGCAQCLVTTVVAMIMYTRLYLYCVGRILHIHIILVLAAAQVKSVFFSFYLLQLGPLWLPVLQALSEALSE